MLDQKEKVLSQRYEVIGTQYLFLAYDFPIRISMNRYMKISLDEVVHLMQTCYKNKQKQSCSAGGSIICNNCLEEGREWLD